MPKTKEQKGISKKLRNIKKHDIRVRVNKEDKRAFRRYCDLNSSNMSIILLNFIKKCLKNKN